MNSQIFPDTIENLNKQRHQELLAVSARARTTGKTPDRAAAHRIPVIDRGYRRPNLLEPLLSAALTAFIALQLAVLLSF